MGILADKAKKMSKWLYLDIGESVVAEYVDFKFVPSRYNPDEESAQYHLKIDGQDKYWDNGSGAVMFQFDAIPQHTIIIIYRNQKLDSTGKAISGKSIWKIEKFNDDADKK